MNAAPQHHSRLGLCRSAPVQDEKWHGRGRRFDPGQVHQIRYPSLRSDFNRCTVRYNAPNFIHFFIGFKNVSLTHQRQDALLLHYDHTVCSCLWRGNLCGSKHCRARDGRDKQLDSHVANYSPDRLGRVLGWSYSAIVQVDRRDPSGKRWDAAFRRGREGAQKCGPRRMPWERLACRGAARCAPSRCRARSAGTIPAGIQQILAYPLPTHSAGEWRTRNLPR